MFLRFSYEESSDLIWTLSPNIWWPHKPLNKMYCRQRRSHSRKRTFIDILLIEMYNRFSNWLWKVIIDRLSSLIRLNNNKLSLNDLIPIWSNSNKICIYIKCKPYGGNLLFSQLLFHIKDRFDIFIISEPVLKLSQRT